MDAYDDNEPFEEFVPPSDTEEMEELRSHTDDYWASASSAIKRNLATLWLDPPRLATGSSEEHTTGLRTQTGSPKRKRRKLSSFVSSHPDEYSGSDNERSSPTSLGVEGLGQGIDDEPHFSPSRDNTPPVENPEVEERFVPSSVSPVSQVHERHAFDGFQFGRDVDSAEPGHRDSSADPLLLLTPSSRKSRVVLDSAGYHSSLHSTPYDHVAGTSNRMSSSPITPVRHLSVSPKSRLPRSATNSPHSATNTTLDEDPNRAGPSNHAEIPTVEHDDEPRRYSLRARNARQMQPYVYDKLSYKKQLRNIPEAIVVAHSPRRRRQSPQYSSDPEVDPNVLQLGDSDGERRRRRVTPDPPPITPDADEPAPHQYPSVLDINLSSDSEAGSTNGVLSSRRDAPRRRVKRRMRTFPMSEKQYSKRSTKQHHEEAHDNGSDVEVVLAHERDTNSLEGADLGLVIHRSASVPPTSSSVGRSSDVEIYDARAPSPSPPPTHVGGSDAVGALLIRSSSDSEPHGASSGSSDAEAFMESLSRRERQALRRMMPHAMLKRELARVRDGAATQARRGRDGDGPTAGDVPTAGHAHKRLVPNARGHAEIRGDTESESDGKVGSRDGGSEGEVDRRGWGVISIFSEDEDDGEAPMKDEISDEEVDDYMRSLAPERRRGERTLVDYMLAGNRTAGDGRKGKKSTSRKRRAHDVRMGTRTGETRPRLTSTGFKIEVGADRGKHRQTRLSNLLTHAHDTDSGTDGDVRAGRRAHDSSARSPHKHDGPTHNAYEIMHKAAQRKRSKAQKTANVGLHVFVGSGRIATGRAHTTAISIDAEAESRAPRSSGFALDTRKGHRKRTKSRRSSGLPVASSTLEDCWLPAPPRSGSEPELEPEPPSPARAQHALRHIDVDAGVPVLPVGIAFGPDTFLGKGLLRDLIQSRYNAPKFAPAAGYIYGVAFSHATPVREFADVVQEQFARLVARLSEVGDGAVDSVRGYDSGDDRGETEGELKEWSRFFRASCQHVTWFASRADAEELKILHQAVEQSLAEACKLAKHSISVKLSVGSATHSLVLETLWTAIEMATRVDFGASDATRATVCADALVLLMQLLWVAGLEHTFHCVARTPVDSPVDYSQKHSRLAETWICLIHLLRPSDGRAPVNSFWHLLRQARHTCPDFRLDNSPSQASELLWRTMFILCALSQFSVQGVTTSKPHLSGDWNLIELGLSLVNLTYDSHIPRATQVQRDRYIRILIRRCAHLHHKWQWTLADASPVFNQMYKIFQSRRFGNLLHEKAEFPDFLCQTDLGLLYVHNAGDSAFTSFLKLVVQSATPSIQVANGSAAEALPPTVKRLLALLVPVGTVPFANAMEATVRESSMLFNRLSAVAIALFLERSFAAAKSRISQARRYVDFKEANMGTRYACIRGLMYLTTMLRHLDLPLEEAMTWLGSMADALIDEYCLVNTAAANERRTSQHRITLCIQMLLGSVRCIVETASMDKSAPRLKYPEPTLLSGPWLIRVISRTNSLSTISSTRQQIQLLVMAFLEARSKIISKPSHDRENEEESQEYYHGLDQIDFDDPALAAALDDNPETMKIKAYEKETCNVIQENVWPAVHRFACMDLSELANELVLGINARMNAWIQCWVRCASILVQSRQREWPWFFSVGIPTANNLSPPARFKIELSFKFAILDWDPQAYTNCCEKFVESLLKSLVVHQVTIEHEFIALVLTVDGLKHPLLSGLPFEPPMPSGGFTISKTDFLNKREDMLDHTFRNLELRLKEESKSSFESRDKNGIYLEAINAALATMKEIYQDLHMTDREDYAVFCRAVYEKLMKNSPLLHRALAVETVSWITELSSSS